MTNQAVILARGLGTRMQRDDGTSLSDAEHAAASSGAKGMMPVRGRPFLDYVVSALADGGITDVVLVIAPDNTVIREHYAGAAPARITIKFAEQEQPRGTADAVASARSALHNGPFLVLNSDNYYPAEDVRALAGIGASGLVAYAADELARTSGIERERIMRYALLDIAPDDTLRSIVEKPAREHPLAAAKERWVSMNLWSFTPVIFEACVRVQPSMRGELELQDAVTIAMRELGERFTVLRRHGSVLDLSQRADVAVVRERLAGVVARP